MKVAFHFQNDTIKDIDFSKIEEGNPGIGGSKNSHILIPTLITKRGILDSILLANCDSKFASCVEYDVVGSAFNALKYCREHNIKRIVYDAKFISINEMKQFPDIEIVLWVHNNLSLSQLRQLSSMHNVVRLIHVGREYNDLYRDMRVFRKSSYIFNSFNMEYLRQYMQGQLPWAQRGNNVVYIGSLIPVKGFHLLASAWKDILKEVPDAQLYVIGSGKLYNRNAKLGSYNLAEESYEKQFMAPLMDEHGKILDSVHFLGLMGVEKFDVMKRCKVGVPNPSGLSETFGNTAVELALMGCNVTTIQCTGYIDSVYNKEHLYKHPSELAKYVVKYLRTDNVDFDAQVKYIEENFALDVIVQKWEQLLSSDLSQPVVAEPIASNDLNYHNKRIKELIRKSTPYSMKAIIPSVEWFYPSLWENLYGGVKSVGKKLLSKLK